jgi:hypothetical protein
VLSGIADKINAKVDTLEQRFQAHLTGAIPDNGVSASTDAASADNGSARADDMRTGDDLFSVPLKD